MMKVVLVHETIHDDYNIQFAKLKSLAYSLFIKGGRKDAIKCFILFTINYKVVTTEYKVIINNNVRDEVLYYTPNIST